MKSVFSLCFALALLGYDMSARAQTQGAEFIPDTDQRFYVIQPFYAPDSISRRSLQHIGVEVKPFAGDYVVSALLDSYPAQQAGVRRGDRILTVNGEAFHPIQSFSNSATESEPNTLTRLVSLEIGRDDQRFSLDLHTVSENLYDSRRTAALASVQEFSAGNKTIAYFHPWNLSRNLNDLLGFIQVINSVALSDGLILDLRDSYGFLSIQHLDAFLPSRQSLFAVAGPGNLHTRINPDAPSLLARHYGKPVAILINSDTAGGAELLASQLGRLARVTTIGEATAGELGDYRLTVIDGASALGYQAPTGTTVDGMPMEDFHVVPELEIPYPLSQTTRNDPQFEAAFNVLLGRI